MTTEADFIIEDADGTPTVEVSVQTLQDDMSAEELYDRVTEAITSCVSSEQVVRR